MKKLMIKLSKKQVTVVIILLIISSSFAIGQPKNNKPYYNLGPYRYYEYSKKFPFYDKINEYSVKEININNAFKYINPSGISSREIQNIQKFLIKQKYNYRDIKKRIDTYKSNLEKTKYFLNYQIPKEDEDVPTEIKNKRAKEAEEVIDTLNKAINQLNENREILEKAINQAETATEVIKSISFKEQEFRKKISLWAFLVIGVLILVGATLLGIWLIKNRDSKENMISEIFQRLLGHNGLQFVTLFILIVVIMIFGILDIVNRQLITIIASIAGYILGTSNRYTSPEKISKSQNTEYEENKEQTKQSKNH